eukprot:CAMPEP_0183340906 /NCGR_PEP_ID=MMETSP0164_2-20130417/7299_1 /TAXON_ID=221442 /ORGANISM="Coccolithus pelagicus ssp braarudi, Strain PLY182g" /LENGTH=63 /DNA_ID=CAMNT_0025511113 /DNA_START=103 /DNA_END=294 /DNA_ORIENTATION=-
MCTCVRNAHPLYSVAQPDVQKMRCCVRARERRSTVMSYENKSACERVLSPTAKSQMPMPFETG